MRTITTEEIEEAVYGLAKKACLRLTPSCTRAIAQAAEREEADSAARFALETVLQNAQTAKLLPVMGIYTDELARIFSFTDLNQFRQ